MFNVVHAHQVLHHVARPVDVLTEMRRVCTRGGVVGVSEVVYVGTLWGHDSPALDHWLSNLIQMLVSAVARELGINRVACFAWAHRTGIFTSTYADARR